MRTGRTNPYANIGAFSGCASRQQKQQREGVKNAPLSKHIFDSDSGSGTFRYSIYLDSICIQSRVPDLGVARTVGANKRKGKKENTHGGMVITFVCFLFFVIHELRDTAFFCWLIVCLFWAVNNIVCDGNRQL